MEYFRIAIEFLQALAWPALVLYVLVAYRGPLRQLILMVPQKLEQTSKFSFGSLVLEMQATLTSAGDPALAKELPRLSRAAYEQLLTMQSEDDVLTLITYHRTNEERGIVLADSAQLGTALELDRVGLIESTEPLKNFIQFANSLPQSPIPHDEGTWIVEDTLSDEEKSRLTLHHCKVTPRGRKLYEVMIGAVLSSLTVNSSPHSQLSAREED